MDEEERGKDSEEERLTRRKGRGREGGRVGREETGEVMCGGGVREKRGEGTWRR